MPSPRLIVWKRDWSLNWLTMMLQSSPSATMQRDFTLHMEDEKIDIRREKSYVIKFIFRIVEVNGTTIVATYRRSGSCRRNLWNPSNMDASLSRAGGWYLCTSVTNQTIQPIALQGMDWPICTMASASVA